MNAALKSCTSMIECHRFLYAVGFKFGPAVSKEMFERIQAGESFTEITNDFNLRGLL